MGWKPYWNNDSSSVWSSFSFSSSFRLVAIFKSYWGVPQFQYRTDIKFTPPVCKSRSYKDAAVQRAETLHYIAALWCRALLALFLSKIFDRAAKFWKGGGGGGEREPGSGERERERERERESLACQIILGVSMSVQSEAVNDVQTVGLLDAGTLKVGNWGSKTTDALSTPRSVSQRCSGSLRQSFCRRR